MTSMQQFLGEQQPESMTVRERMNRERRWVGWKVKFRDGDPTKVLVNPATGWNASSTDPSTWGWLADAERAVQQFSLAGVGFVLGDGWAGADIDGPPAWKKSSPSTASERDQRRTTIWERLVGAQQVGGWVHLIGGYAEFSPNNGIKIIVPGFAPTEADQQYKNQKADKDGKNDEGGLEVYWKDRYFTVTGQAIIDRAEADLDAFRDLAACRPPRGRTASPAPAPSMNGTTPYGAEALRGEIAELRSTPEGNRNNQLNDSAFNLGQLIPAELDEAEARHELISAALACGLGPDEIKATLDHALRDGMAQPRTAPPRTTPTRTREAGVQAAVEQEHVEPGEIAWRPLRPFTNEIVGPGFPEEILSGGKAGFSGDLAAHVPVPVDMIASLLIPQVSAAIHGKAVIELPNGYQEESPVRTMCPARTGERKSTAISYFEAPLYSMESNRAETSRHRIAEYEAALEAVEWEIAALKKKAKDRLDEGDLQKLMVKKSDLEATQPGAYRFLVSDVTPEQLAVILSANEGHGLLMLSAEAGFLKNFTTRYTTESNLDLFLKSFSGEPYTYDRRSQPAVRLRRPRLSGALLPQPILFQQLLDDDEFVHRGAMPRFLFALPASLMGTRSPEGGNPFPKVELDAWIAFIEGLVADERETPYVVRLSIDASKTMIDWCWELERRLGQSGSDAFDGCLSRLEGTSFRLLLALHVIECGDRFDTAVGGEAAERAVELARYYEAGYEMALLGMSGASGVVRDARTLLYWLRRRRGVVTLSDVGSSRSWSSPRIRDALEELEERGYIVMRKAQTGGAPKNVIELRPEEA